MILVSIPAAAIDVGVRKDGHERYSGLDQAPGEQSALADGVPAVAVAQALGFLSEVECLLGSRRGQEREGPAIEGIHRVQAAALFHAALLGVEKALLPYVNENDCGRYWDLWMLTNPEPDEDGIALARTTLEAVAGVGNPSAPIALSVSSS